MKEKKITCVEEYLKEIQKYSGTGRIYRGMSKISYKLIPSIGRYYGKGRYDPKSFHDAEKAYFDAEKYSLEMFKRETWQYLNRTLQSDWDYLALAQNHGMCTRFLDWTFWPLVALYFAVEKTDGEYEDEDGVVYSIRDVISYYNMYDKVLREVRNKPPSPFDAYNLELDLDEYKKIKPAHITLIGDLIGYNPTHVSPNITAQNGVLTLFLDPKKETTMPDVKFRIIGKEKYSIKDELYSFGIERKTLFPGLDGVGKSIRTQKFEMIYYHRSFTKKISRP